MSQKKVLICVTGSIAAYRVCDILSELRKQELQVTCVLSSGGKQFITPLSLRALSGGEVYEDMFEKFDGVLHTTLADESDLIVVMPASANAVARLAQGMADDLMSCTILASKAKVLLVPAMNDNMYQHPLTQANLKQLSGLGYEVLDPVKGPLVCGREEVGHIASQEAILERISALLK